MQQIGAYELLGELGRGATGVVYRARQSSLNREVALKVLAPALAADPEYATRFHREAELAASLDHPLIVTIFDTGVADGCHYIAMRLVQGVTLDQALQGRPPNVPAALQVALQMGDALAYAHGKGIIHRDLKPANVLVTHEGKIALADFGIARAAEATGNTLAGQVLGTPEYMSPEQARGEPADARSDIYSLGMILYRMLAGRPAFTGGDALSVIYRQANEEPERLASLNPAVPPAVDAFVHTCLVKEPAARFQSADAFLEALKAAASAPAAPATSETHARPRTAGAPAAERELGILSVDVVRSMQMKRPGESQELAAIFAAYRALANNVLKEHGCLAQCWSGDGLLALFPDTEGALRAGKALQRALPRFNRDHRAEGARMLKVRAAVHLGSVPWQPGVQLGEVTSRALDLTARLQKACQPGEVVASWEAFSRIEQREGFLPGPGAGPLAGAYCWSEWQEHQQVQPKAPAAEAPLDPVASTQLRSALAMQALSAPREGGGPWMRFLGIAVALGAVAVGIWGIGRALRPPARTVAGAAAIRKPDARRAAPAAAVPLQLPSQGELRWTYVESSPQSGGAPAHVTETLSGEVPLAGETVRKLTSSAGSDPGRLARVARDGLVIYGTLGPDGQPALTFDPPYRLLPNPIPFDPLVTQTFVVHPKDPQAANGGGRVTLSVTSESQRRTVPAGIFDAYPFRLQEEISTPAGGTLRTEHHGWLAPGAGIIEEDVSETGPAGERTARRVLESKSF